MKRYLTILLCVWAAICTLCATPRVSLLTCSPGSEVYELEGHTALRVTDSISDIAYNWGTFDFASPNFLYRFVKGETDYMLSAAPTGLFLDHYRRHGREVTEQVLNLNEEQTQRLLQLVDENMRSENRVYRYNYVLDNCATRPLLLIEKASGDTITLPPYEGHGSTFRRAMMNYHKNYPWYQFGIDLALGSGIDMEITDRQKGFAPMDLMEMMRIMQISDGDGGKKQIISEENIIVEGNPAIIGTARTPLWGAPEFCCLAVAALTALSSLIALRRRKLNRTVQTIIFGIYGIAGILLTFLIFISVHEATSPNLLYLWLNPGCLFLAVGIWIKSWKNAVYWWQFINFALVMTLVVLGALGRQHLNCAFWPLIISDLILSLTYILIYRCTVLHPQLRKA